MTIIAIPMGVPGAGKSTLCNMFTELGRFKTIGVSDLEVSTRREASRIALVLTLLTELILSKKLESSEKVKNVINTDNYLKALELNKGSFNGAMEYLIINKDFLNITIKSEELKLLKKEIEEKVWMPSCYDILNLKIKEILSESSDNNIFYDVGARQYNEIIRIKKEFPSLKVVIIHIKTTPECVSMRWMNQLSVKEIESKDLAICKRTNFYNELIKVTKTTEGEEARKVLLNDSSAYNSYKDFINKTLVDRINSIDSFLNTHPELKTDVLEIENLCSYEEYIEKIKELIDKIIN